MARVYGSYEGKVSKKLGDPDARRAYRIYYAQRDRCYNKSVREYKWYGAKGIKIEYTMRQFVFWYIESVRSTPFKKPSIDRIDHSKNYSIENIRMVEWVENLRERNSRCGNPAVHRKRKIEVFEHASMKKIDICDSTVDAARIYGTHPTTISAICRGKRFYTRRGYTFRYKK